MEKGKLDNSTEKDTVQLMYELYSEITSITALHIGKTKDYSIISRYFVYSSIVVEYNRFVRSGELLPIEQATPELKRKSWDIVKDFNLTYDSKIKAAKAAYLIINILEK